MASVSPARGRWSWIGIIALGLAAALVLALVCLAVLQGLGNTSGPERGYGGTHGASINGTGTLAELLKSRGHEVRSAWRLTPELSTWADAIVRFAAVPGPPGENEADWYEEWLSDRPDRALVYVVRDFDAEAEYWSLAVQRLGEAGDQERRMLAEANRDKAGGWASRLPRKEETPADPETWFAVGKPASPPRTCKTLGGPWAEDIDPEAAALVVHEPLKPTQEVVLLTGDGDVLAMEWEVDRGSRVLAIANGSFLLNLPLVNRARRPLAEAVLEWIGDEARRVAFVEGSFPLEEAESPPTLIDLIRQIKTFRWVAIHLSLLGVLACLARAPRLGRPRPDPPSDADRPAAHAEALGTLLQRTRGAAAAKELLETYRRWRFARTPHEGTRATGEARPQQQPASAP